MKAQVEGIFDLDQIMERHNLVLPDDSVEGAEAEGRVVKNNFQRIISDFFSNRKTNHGLVVENEVEDSDEEKDGESKEYLNAINGVFEEVSSIVKEAPQVVDFIIEKYYGSDGSSLLSELLHSCAVQDYSKDLLIAAIKSKYTNVNNVDKGKKDGVHLSAIDVIFEDSVIGPTTDRNVLKEVTKAIFESAASKKSKVEFDIDSCLSKSNSRVVQSGILTILATDSFERGDYGPAIKILNKKLDDHSKKAPLPDERMSLSSRVTVSGFLDRAARVVAGTVKRQEKIFDDYDLLKSLVSYSIGFNNDSMLSNVIQKSDRDILKRVFDDNDFLLEAVKLSHAKTFRIITSNGFYDERANDVKDVLSYAINNGQSLGYVRPYVENIPKKILKDVLNGNDESNTVLDSYFSRKESAAINNDIVKLLLDNGGEFHNSTPMIFSYRNKHVETLKYLVGAEQCDNFLNFCVSKIVTEKEEDKDGTLFLEFCNALLAKKEGGNIIERDCLEKLFIKMMTDFGKDQGQDQDCHNLILGTIVKLKPKEVKSFAMLEGRVKSSADDRVESGSSNSDLGGSEDRLTPPTNTVNRPGFASSKKRSVVDFVLEVMLNGANKINGVEEKSDELEEDSESRVLANTIGSKHDLIRYLEIYSELIKAGYENSQCQNPDSIISEVQKMLPQPKSSVKERGQGHEFAKGIAASYAADPCVIL